MRNAGKASRRKKIRNRREKSVLRKSWIQLVVFVELMCGSVYFHTSTYPRFIPSF